MRHLLAKSFTLGLYLIINPTQAQSIINTSSISHDLDSTLSIVIDAGGNISRGNSRVDDVNLNFGLGKSLGEDASVWLLGGHNELRGNGSLLQKTSFIHLRYNYELNNRTTLSAYSQSQLNTVLDLESRVLFGGNISYDFSKEQNATAMIGLFYEAEKYAVSDSKSMVRMNFVGVAEQKLGNIEVIGFAYYQPSIMDLFDSRYITEISLRFPIVKGFQLSVNGAGRFDSQPHSSLRNWDVGVSTTLRYEFHKS